VQEAELTRKQHAFLLALMAVLIVSIFLAAGIYLPGFWFGVVWIIFGLGGWSFRFEQKKSSGWAIVPSAILGGAAMLYHLNKVIVET
jgi:hypothetical protein